MNPEATEEPPSRLDLTLHLPAGLRGLLPAPEVRRWLDLVLSEASQQLADLSGERGIALGIAVVGPDCSRKLNSRYRQRDYPANVLSFPSGEIDECGRLLLGDLLLCLEVIQEESGRYGVPQQERFAHLVVHGLLHLLGFDHAEPESAGLMESLESKLLRRLGFADPWQEASGSLTDR